MLKVPVLAVFLMNNLYLKISPSNCTLRGVKYQKQPERMTKLWN